MGAFETTSNQYLNGLITGGTFISGDIIGVKEDLENSEAIISYLVNGMASERKIKIFKQNGELNWAFLSPIKNNEIEYTTDDWNYPSYAKRIIAPVSLLNDIIGISIYNWFQINGMPVLLRETNSYLYCNVILPEHQSIIDQLGGIITIEDRN